MNIQQINENVKNLTNELVEETFIYDFLLAYGTPKATITRLEKGDYNLSKKSGELLWKNKLFFKIELDSDLHELIDDIKNNSEIRKKHPRFILVTDFKSLLAIDTENNDSLDIRLKDLSRQFDFFLPLAGMEKKQLHGENPADVKAAEKLGKLYDLVLKDNPPKSDAERHALNVFLARLLFCFFAEDTEIFEKDQFTNAIASHTSTDGSDLKEYLETLFQVLNKKTRKNLPKYLDDFPYVNGGLFEQNLSVPKFTFKSRNLILESGTLNWSEINPDIFGSMIQAVVNHGKRSDLGIHYTSVVNIMRLIQPLFLDDLTAELQSAGSSKVKLTGLLNRIYNLRVFDPACGSGNFLIIAYKELCRLETEIFRRLYGSQVTFRFDRKVSLNQFYGIEIDDFAHETARLSLWLAEHQMNLAFKETFGQTRPTLPLQEGGNIICANSNLTDWNDVCPVDNQRETFLIGNPPYLGFKQQTSGHKQEIKKIYGKAIKLDYISCWFKKAGEFIRGRNNYSFAFVTTNSICQGEQVALLWEKLLSNTLEIFFCHTSFKWQNSAKGQAAVICVIVGVRNKSPKDKFIFTDARKITVPNINAYLAAAKDTYIKKRRVPLSNLPEMTLGDMAKDGGHLFLSLAEKNQFLAEYPHFEKFIKRIVGADEFINDKYRWCFWIHEDEYDFAKSNPVILGRLKKVSLSRLESDKKATQEFSKKPYRFVEVRYQKVKKLLIPTVSSERRDYIPIGFFGEDDVINAPNNVVYDPDPLIFGIIHSRMHMVWVRAVGGRLKTDYRYSTTLCYNNFPFPKISEATKVQLENFVFRILDVRELYPHFTIAELYDPDKMPADLRQAHQYLDNAIEGCYRTLPFRNDDERLTHLFNLYEQMLKKESKE